MMRFFLLVSLFFAVSNCCSQVLVDSVMEELATKYLQEKIYIEKNKARYISGETVLFKAFLFSGYQPSGISSNLYTEILDRSNNVIAQTQSPVVGGVSEASVKIPEKLQTGQYFLRAYTTWMLNFDERFQYLQPLVIYQPESITALVRDTAKWSFSAVPEGGKLVDGIETKIAIRFFNLQQDSKAVYGTLWDKTQHVAVINIGIIDRNVGLCNFVPHAGHDYEIEIRDGLNQPRLQPLPAVLASGVVMHTVQVDSLLTYRIYFKNTSPGKTYKLIGITDNTIVYKATFQNNDTVFERTFPVKNMSPGVLYFTLFDESMSVIAERLCFLSPQKPHAPEISILKKNIHPRGENEISVRTDSSSVFYISAVGGSGDEDCADGSVESAVWLTADFTAKIENAAGYFQNKTDAAKQALDAIMIAEKWQRFNWGELLSGNFPKINYYPENYLSFNGIAVYNNAPLTGAALNLMVFYADSSRQVLQVQTDNWGQFVLHGLLFEGDAKVNFYSTDKKIRADLLKVELTPVNNTHRYLLQIPETNLVEVMITPSVSDLVSEGVTSLANDLKMKGLFKELEAVTVKTKIKSATRKLDEKLSSGRFYNPRETVYDFVNKDQRGAGLNVAQWLVGKVICDAYNPCAYYLDEFLTDRSQLAEINITDVALIKIQGKLNAHQIFVYLKKGEEMQAANKSLTNSLIITGYPVMENPFAMYAAADYSRVISTDTRKNLLWSNFIYLDKGAAPEFYKFFNNDNAKQVKVRLTGVSSDNLPFFYEMTLE